MIPVNGREKNEIENTDFNVYLPGIHG